MDELPNNLNDFYINSDSDKDNEDKEAFDYFSMYHSNGFSRLKEYIKDIKESISYISKQKSPEESLESYAAKRMSADAVVDSLDNLVLHVENQASNYNPNKK